MTKSNQVNSFKWNVYDGGYNDGNDDDDDDDENDNVDDDNDDDDYVNDNKVDDYIEVHMDRCITPLGHKQRQQCIRCTLQ